MTNEKAGKLECTVGNSKDDGTRVCMKPRTVIIKIKTPYGAYLPRLPFIWQHRLLALARVIGPDEGGYGFTVFIGYTGKRYDIPYILYENARFS